MTRGVLLRKGASKRRKVVYSKRGNKKVAEEENTFSLWKGGGRSLSSAQRDFIKRGESDRGTVLLRRVISEIS